MSNSGPSDSQVVPVNYITVSGPNVFLAPTPYTFSDGLVLKSEAELQTMDLNTMIQYTSTVSTSIGLETSSLNANLGIQAMYSVLSQLSQSTIDGLGTEITLNTSMIDTYKQTQDILDNFSTSYISTMLNYDATIATQLDTINFYNSTLSSYSKEYDNTVSSVSLENSIFVTAAIQYSSLYYVYLGYQQQYDSNASSLALMDLNLSTAMQLQDASQEALNESTIRWKDTGDMLNSLYIDRVNIASTVTQFRIDETNSYLNYTSSLTALGTISSIYNSALANENYNLALSTSIQMTANYADALEQFQLADLLYNNTIPQGSSLPGDSVLLATRKMAEDRVTVCLRLKETANSSKDLLLYEAGRASTTAYEAILLGYDQTILAYETVQQKYYGYKISSLDAVAKYSSIYEEAVTDINTYTEQINYYSSLYVSSINASSTLFGYDRIDQSTLTGDIQYYNAVSWSISSLNQIYNTSLDQYNSTVLTSTLFGNIYASSLSNVIVYGDYYASTNSGINVLSNQLYGTSGLINIYNTLIFNNSSLLNSENIAIRAYNATTMNYINMQDESMYQYRESFCRTKQQEYQTTYEANVFNEVQVANSATQSLIAAAPPGVTVTPIPVNLTSPLITTTYTQLNSINTFLTSFTDIYTSFDLKDSYITQLSTSIGYEKSSWSTVDSYTRLQYFSTAKYSSLTKLITASCANLASAQDSTTALLNTCAITQSTIDTKKVAILSKLGDFFAPANIATQNDTISSFITQSLAAVVAAYQSQGVTLIV